MSRRDWSRRDWRHWTIAIPLGVVLVFVIPMFLGITLG